jgi:hypothetical protein
MPVDPISIAVSQALNIIPSIFQGVVGISQLSKAKKIEKENPRPEATIAESIDKLVKYAYGQTLQQDTPGGELARGEIKGATSAGITAASELGLGAEAYGMLGQLVGREQNAISDIAKTTAQQVQGAKGAYMDTLPVKASEENRVWNWNEGQPYMQAAQTASAMRDSGTKNIMSGMKNIFGAGAEYLNPDLTSSLLGNKGTNFNKGNYSLEELQAILAEIDKIGNKSKPE